MSKIDSEYGYGFPFELLDSVENGTVATKDNDEIDRGLVVVGSECAVREVLLSGGGEEYGCIEVV